MSGMKPMILSEEENHIPVVVVDVGVEDIEVDEGDIDDLEIQQK